MFYYSLFIIHHSSFINHHPPFITLTDSLVSHWNVHARGFPDLILVRKQSPSSSTTAPTTSISANTPAVLFVEVKGCKDRVRDDQLYWLGVFEERGINVEVCQVSQVRTGIHNCVVLHGARDGHDRIIRKRVV